MSYQLQSQNCKSATARVAAHARMHLRATTGELNKFTVTEQFFHRQSLLMSHCYRPELSLKYNPMTLEGKKSPQTLIFDKFWESFGSKALRQIGLSEAMLIRPSRPCKYFFICMHQVCTE